MKKFIRHAGSNTNITMTMAHNITKTSNALVTLVKTKQDCLKKLLKTVRTTPRISELLEQRVLDRRTGDRKRPTAICVETTARYNELVTVCRNIRYILLFLQ